MVGGSRVVDGVVLLTGSFLGWWWYGGCIARRFVHRQGRFEYRMHFYLAS